MTIQLKAVYGTSFPLSRGTVHQPSKVFMTFEAEDKIFKCGEMKATEQPFHVVPYILLYKAIVTLIL